MNGREAEALTYVVSRGRTWKRPIPRDLPDMINYMSVSRQAAVVAIKFDTVAPLTIRISGLTFTFRRATLRRSDRVLIAEYANEGYANAKTR